MYYLCNHRIHNLKNKLKFKFKKLNEARAINMTRTGRWELSGALETTSCSHFMDDSTKTSRG